MPVPTPPLRPYPDCPLVVAYGLGVDSTAMLIEFARRGIRPDLILFADTGGEKPETYAYLRVIRPYLAGVGFPDVTVVRYQPKRAAYRTLEGQCLHTGTLPSLAYAGKSC
jgi:3'-phosphoadenosine 5'-phosphosulfate sulfotransferase (PAPS reductase)/FAD synthetase